MTAETYFEPFHLNPFERQIVLLLFLCGGRELADDELLQQAGDFALRCADGKVGENEIGAAI